MHRPMIATMARKQNNGKLDEVGVFEAKTTLSKLLERVAAGETIVITRHGKPVAQLGPCVGFDAEQAATAMASLLGRDTGWRLPPGTTIKDLINEGRR